MTVAFLVPRHQHEHDMQPSPYGFTAADDSSLNLIMMLMEVNLYTAWPSGTTLREQLELPSKDWTTDDLGRSNSRS